MKLDSMPTETIVVPQIDEVRRLGREALDDLDIESDEFGRLNALAHSEDRCVSLPAL